jgi:putative tricarboxylic transport membrane protein
MSERVQPEKGSSGAAEGGGQGMPPASRDARTENAPSPQEPQFRFSIRSPRDFWGGLVLIALAILAIWASRDLPGQRGFAFGPGTAPRLFAGVLAALGAAVALMGIIEHGPPIEKYKFRGPILVVIGILSFAALVRPLGLVPATFSAFVISILGTTEMRWIESLIAGAIMTLFCVLLFVYLLGLPFQLWPRLY